MTTAWGENPNLWVHVQEPSEWCGRSKHILLTQRGWKVREFPALGKVVLLTFPFIERTFRSVTSGSPVIRPEPMLKTGECTGNLVAIAIAVVLVVAQMLRRPSAGHFQKSGA